MGEKKTFKCAVCGNDFVGSWTDFYGEATCVVCGTPYQLLEPSGADPALTYPHISIDGNWLPIFKEYWNETHTMHREGVFMDDYGQRSNQRLFRNWLQIHHPDLLEK